MEPSNDLTRVLAELRAGDPSAEDKLFPFLHDELHRLASAAIGKERQGHTLQPTALVHEAYLRLFGSGQPDWENRRHFFGAAARAMRRVLVEHARARRADKRGGGQARVTLDEALDFTEDRSEEVIAVDEALQKLASADPRKARVIELRFFCGLSSQETAEALEISERTVERDWSFARAWLYREIGAS